MGIGFIDFQGCEKGDAAVSHLVEAEDPLQDAALSAAVCICLFDCSRVPISSANPINPSRQVIHSSVSNMAWPLSSFNYLRSFMAFSIDNLGKYTYRRRCE